MTRYPQHSSRSTGSGMDASVSTAGYPPPDASRHSNAPSACLSTSATSAMCTPAGASCPKRCSTPAISKERPLRSNGLAGLIAALTAEDRLDEATAAAIESMPILRRSGMLLARCDILACLMARCNHAERAARLLGASDRFRADCETPRDPIEQRCRDLARAYVHECTSDDTRVAWMAAGASAGEDEVVEAFASLR